MQPALFARAVLDRFAIQGSPDVYQLAASMKIPIHERPLDSCEGMLVRIKGTAVGVIAVRDSIREEGRRLFTIAHELGHLVLPGHEDCGTCTSADIETWSKQTKEREVEANTFAAELLMPTAVVKHVVSAAEPSFAVVEALAATCRTSLTASAWRFVDITPHSCAVVWSQGRWVKWARKSEGFRHWLRLREALDTRTLARDLFDGSAAPLGPHPVPASAWIENVADDNAMIMEESQFLPFYDAVLTLLWEQEPIKRDPEELAALDPIEFGIGRRRWTATKR